jgi:hypothetical protein
METGINNRLITPIILLLILLTSCQATPLPPPITASVSDEFILHPGQSAAILNTNLTLKLIAVSNDERCPLKIECAMSGPVTLSISIQNGDNEPAEFILQAFTDGDGRAPEGPFEGIQDRVEYEGYLIRVKAVLPYPLNRSGEIKDSEYQVSFVVILK